MTAIALAMCLALSGCNRLSADPSAPASTSASSPRSASASTPTNRTVTVTTKDGARQAIVVHPTNAGVKPALVVMLHGGFGSDTQAEKAYGWDDEATHDGFVVAYPNGVDKAWNVGNCCGAAQRSGVDDVAFLHALVAQLEQTDGVDPKRVYAVGMSNGAMMTYTWACRDPGELAAIGPVAGTLGTPCPSPHPITVIAIHGTADQHVPIDGGVGPAGRTGVSYDSLAQSLAPFIAADGCADSPAVAKAPPLTTSVWTCAAGQSVTTRVVDGAGHQWPGSIKPSTAGRKLLGIDPPSTAFDATDFLWQQLSPHRAD
ncbi:MAG: alpha/beta hydrolase family esterase [Acidothermaceae bacterium]